MTRSRPFGVVRTYLPLVGLPPPLSVYSAGNRTARREAMDTSTGPLMRRLTPQEADLLAQARWLLMDLERAASGRVMGASEPRQRSVWDGYQLGLIQDRCEVADEAIFGALNCLASYGDDPEAARVLAMRRATAYEEFAEAMGLEDFDEGPGV